MIRERDSIADTAAGETALACVEAGIEAVHPRNVVRTAVSVGDGDLRVADDTYHLSGYDEVIVVGGGKAAGTVAAELEAILGDRLTRGMVVTDAAAQTRRIEVHEAAHPVPDDRGVAGANAVLDMVTEAGNRTLVIAVVTGGASALLPAPAEGISLADLRATTTALLESGASIGDVNVVRKHLSAIKGGWLAHAAAPATVVTLAFSDVVGDDPAVIGSGPTVPDPSTYDEALSVVERLEVDPPTAVSDRLERGAAGDIAETPGPGDPAFHQCHYHTLADGFTAVAAAAATGADRGFSTTILTSRLRGEAREVAKAVVAVGEEVRASGNPVPAPAVVVAGGETTVTVHGGGTGGPNQELALAAAMDLRTGVTVAAVDTDGRDGGTDAAGALVDATTVSDRDEAGTALARNDAYPYLDERDALIRTGRTGTNVNDLYVLVVD